MFCALTGLGVAVEGAAILLPCGVGDLRGEVPAAGRPGSRTRSAVSARRSPEPGGRRLWRGV